MKKLFTIPLLILILTLFPLSAYATEIDIPTESNATVCSVDIAMLEETQTEEEELDVSLDSYENDSTIFLEKISEQLAVTNILLSALFVYLFIHYSIKTRW